MLIQLTRQQFAFYRGYRDRSFRYRDRRFRKHRKFGHVQPEWPVTLHRNRRSRSSGITGHVAPEYPLASRYLEKMTAGEVESLDLRFVQSRVKWVRDQLLVAARRAGRPTIARLVAVEPEMFRVTYAKPVPTFEEFREERDP